MNETELSNQSKSIKEFAEVDKQIVTSVNAIESQSIVLAKALRRMATEQQDGKPLWSIGGFSSLKSYCEDRAITKRHFQNLISAGEVIERIECESRQNENSVVRTPANEGQIRPMATLVKNNPESIPVVWEFACDVASNDDCVQPERRHVEEAMREYKARGGNLNSRRKYSDRERELKADCENGWAVVANINTDSALISWAEQKGKYVYVGRGSKWGNPFKLPEDGDRETVCNCYERHYIPHKPSIVSDLGSLVGMVLGCYCSPNQCHADTLASLANQEGVQ